MQGPQRSVGEEDTSKEESGALFSLIMLPVTLPIALSLLISRAFDLLSSHPNDP
jgi:hypothetical protein